MIAAPPKTASPVLIYNRICLIKIPVSLTLHEATRLKEQIQSIYKQKPLPQKIILDFGDTLAIDGSGVGAVISILKAAQSYEIDLTFWSVSTHLKKIFSLAGLDPLFPEGIRTDAITPAERFASDTSLFRTQKTIHPSVTSRLKRLIDIVGAVVGLIITAILFVPIAIAIKLDSPGPILYSQTRYSWMGKPFRIRKFRSMVANADALKHQVTNQVTGAFFKNANDPRITRIGKFLRRTSLDEFPQFWNVLKGEMSLVGTRPPTPDEVEYYDLAEWQRLNVKPGLTGEWQVHGRSQITNFSEVVKLDLKYQQNWNFWYDITLMIKTIAILFRKDNGAV